MPSGTAVTMEEMTPKQEVNELPNETLQIYARLWQLETWLRRMVRVELMALKGEAFGQDIRCHKKAFEADKTLHHMSTPEEDALSYAQFSEVKRLMLDNWEVFSTYLPPRNIWEAKLEEVMQIRHRVAHFRTCHKDDYSRVCQLLRDIDRGFWRFCTSYNQTWGILPASSNPVSAEYMALDPFPWTETADKMWARLGSADPALRVAVTVETTDRIWSVPQSSLNYPGRLYDVHFLARNQRQFELIRLLESTQRLHRKAIFVCLDQFANGLRVTLPSVLGSQQIIEILNSYLEACRSALTSARDIPVNDMTVQRIADAWPEYILGPSNPLAFLSPGMECSFFGA